MGYAWKGTVLTLGSAVAGLMSCRSDRSAEELDVTDAASTEKEYEIAYINGEVTLQTRGVSDIEVGDTGALSILWGATGQTVLYGNHIVTRVSHGGDRGGIVTTDITLRKTPSA